MKEETKKPKKTVKVESTKATKTVKPKAEPKPKVAVAKKTTKSVVKKESETVAKKATATAGTAKASATKAVKSGSASLEKSKGNGKYPSLYQVNTRVLLTDLSKSMKKKATLDDISDDYLTEIADMGFDWVWMLSVWTTGTLSQKVSRTNPDWQGDFQHTLADLKKEDVEGSGFAIADYRVHGELGGDAALKRLRERMSKKGLKLMLDFVPNHMGLDHPWLDSHPEYFICGNEDDLHYSPQNFIKLKTKNGDKVFAYGRDPYFSGWPDTVQLDYSNTSTVKAMKAELLRIADQCDGVRCDMAMLILPDVFERTWGRKAHPFWKETITEIRKKNPAFCMLAEVYWGMEWDLQQVGFDYTYDKTLYDRLRGSMVKAVRDHLTAELDYQRRLSRFLENHDEERANAVFMEDQHKAAAVITYFSPGMRFFHQGQLEGMTKRISPHLVRSPKESVAKGLRDFYTNLLKQLKLNVLRNGDWSLLYCAPAWDGNNSSNNLISYAWENKAGEKVIVITNYCNYPSQGYLKLPFHDIANHKWELDDLLTEDNYLRNGEDLQRAGLYLDMSPWQYHVFVMRKN